MKLKHTAKLKKNIVRDKRVQTVYDKFEEKWGPVENILQEVVA